MIAIARGNIARRSEQNAGEPRLVRTYQEWTQTLERSVEWVVSILLTDDDESALSRQDPRFAGFLHHRKVREISRAARELYRDVAYPGRTTDPLRR